jgi:penicillin-binding protein 1A
VHSAEIPDVVREATVAIEDRRFYQHQGVDFEGTRAAIKNAQSKKDIQGGSTLTMQLVRNLYTGERAGGRGRLQAQDPRGQAGPGARGPPSGESASCGSSTAVNSVPYGTVAGRRRSASRRRRASSSTSPPRA